MGNTLKKYFEGVTSFNSFLELGNENLNIEIEKEKERVIKEGVQQIYSFTEIKVLLRVLIKELKEKRK